MGETPTATRLEPWPWSRFNAIGNGTGPSDRILMPDTTGRANYSEQSLKLVEK